MGKKAKKSDKSTLMVTQAFVPRAFLAITPEIPASQSNSNPVHLAFINAGNMVTSLNFLSPNEDFSKEVSPKTSEKRDSKRVSSVDAGYDFLSAGGTFDRPKSEIAADDDEFSESNQGRAEISLRNSDAFRNDGTLNNNVTQSRNETNKSIGISSSPQKHQYATVGKSSQNQIELEEKQRSSSNAALNLSQIGSPRDGSSLQNSSSMRQENQKLQAKLGDVIKQINELQKEKENYVISLNEREYTIRTLNKTVESLTQESNQLRESLSGMRNKTLSESEIKDTKTREVAQLQATILKLNDQLKMYQEQHGFLTDKDHKKLESFVETKPEWLTNTELLSPLMQAYEDEIRQKDAILKENEEKFQELQKMVNEIVAENRELHLSREGAAHDKEWQNVQEQAKLVLEENQILIEQLNVQSKRSSELNHVHKGEISRLSRSLVAAEADRNFYSSELKQVNEKHEQFVKRFEAMGANKIVTLEEHGNIVRDLNAKIANLEQVHEEEIENLLDKLEISEREFANLLNEKSVSKAEIESLQHKVESVLKAQTKWQKKAALLEKKLNLAQENEELLGQKLELALSAAEKATEERDFYVEEFQTHIDEKNQTINELKDENMTQKGVDENMKAYKMVMKEKLKRLAQDHLATKKEFELKEENYRVEIESLRKNLNKEIARSDHLISSSKLSKSPF